MTLAITCLASSPGRISLTEVWISQEEMVDLFKYAASSAKEREKNMSRPKFDDSQHMGHVEDLIKFSLVNYEQDSMYCST